jgi:hypothetical protein
MLAPEINPGITLSEASDDFKCQHVSTKRKGRKPTPKCGGKK